MPVLTLFVQTPDAAIPSSFKARAYRRLKLSVPEVRLALGPVSEGVTGGGTFAALFSRRWALAVDKGGVMHLFRESGSSWGEVAPLAPLPVLSAAARHVAFVYDGSARPVIAWEEGGAVFIRRWNTFTSQYVVSSIAGAVDPCLWNDALALQTTNNSDSILFHLNTARTQVFSRLERENYSVPRAAGGVLALPSQLDAAVSSNGGLLLALGTDAGLFTLSSPPYPQLSSNSMSASAALQSAAFQTTTFFNQQSDAVAGNSSIAPSAFLLATRNYAAPDGINAGSSIAPSAFLLVTTNYAVSDGVNAASSIAPSAFTLITSFYTDQSAMTGGSSIESGVFE